MTDAINVPEANQRIPSMVGKDRVSFFLNGRFRSYHLKSQQGQELLRLLKEEVQDRDRIGDLADIITWIAKQTNGRVTVEEGTDRLRLDGKLIDYGLSGRVATVVEAGVPFEHLARFIENVSENPDPTVAEDLYRFLEKGSLPITPDGCFMAFKGVGPDGWSKHAGVNGRVLYEVGKTVSMPREECDPNRQRTCSRGLHACSFGYLNYWYRGSDQLLAVKINPKNVTAIPADHDDQKLRCCEMEVMALIPREDAETHFPSVIDTRYPPKPEYPTHEMSDSGRLAGGPPINEDGEPQGWVRKTRRGIVGEWEWTTLPQAAQDKLKFVAPSNAAQEQTADQVAEEAGERDGYLNGRKDKAYDYPSENGVLNTPADFKDGRASQYSRGYTVGYDRGYAEDADPSLLAADSWDLKRALAAGRDAGISEADKDFDQGIYANDPTDVEGWETLTDWIAQTDPDYDNPEAHELVAAFERAYRDAYHTRFNSKQDDAG